MWAVRLTPKQVIPKQSFLGRENHTAGQMKSDGRRESEAWTQRGAPLVHLGGSRRCSANGRCFDIGITIRGALSESAQHGDARRSGPACSTASTATRCSPPTGRRWFSLRNWRHCTRPSPKSPVAAFGTGGRRKSRAQAGWSGAWRLHSWRFAKPTASRSLLLAVNVGDDTETTRSGSRFRSRHPAGPWEAT